MRRLPVDPLLDYLAQPCPRPRPRIVYAGRLEAVPAPERCAEVAEHMPQNFRSGGRPPEITDA
jgi:hypothetical protein